MRELRGGQLLTHLREITEEPLVPALPAGAEAVPNLLLNAVQFGAALPEFATHVVEDPIGTGYSILQMLPEYMQIISRVMKGDEEALREAYQKPFEFIVAYRIAKGITSITAKGIQKIEGLKPETIKLAESTVKELQAAPSETVKLLMEPPTEQIAIKRGLPGAKLVRPMSKDARINFLEGLERKWSEVRESIGDDPLVIKNLDIIRTHINRIRTGESTKGISEPRRFGDIPVFEQLRIKEKMRKSHRYPGVPAEAAEVPKGEAGFLRLPEMEEVKKYARSINLERLDVTETTKRLMTKIGLEKEKRRVSWAETEAKGKALGWDTDAMKKKFKPDKSGFININPARIDAAREINASAAQALGDVIDRMPEVNKLNNENIADLNIALLNYRNIFDTMSEAASEAGRTLNILKKITTPERLMKAIVEKTEGKITTPKEATLLIDELKKLDFNNPAQVNNFIKSMDKPNFMDYVYEYWYNSILSGPPTHFVNSISNTTWGAFLNLGIRPLRAMIDIPISKLQKRQQYYHVREVIPALVGSAIGAKRGIPKAIEMLRRGHIEGDMTKWNYEIISLGAWEKSPHKWMRKVSPAVSLPSRFLRAEDIFARSIAYEAESAAAATRMGIMEGKKGRALAERIVEIMNDRPPAIMEEAGKFADFSTFMDAPEHISRQVMKIRDLKIKGTNIKPFIFVIPFVRTIGNLMKRGLELTPGVGAVMGRGAKGAQVSDVIAKQVAGAMIAYYFAQKYVDGELTGAPPRNKSEREAFYRAGKLPWAVRIKDKWYSYRRIEPFNTVISSVATIGDTYMRRNQEPPIKLIEGIVLDMVRNLLDASYLSGMSSLMKAFEDSYGGEYILEGILAQTVSGFVPYSSAQRSTTRAIEALQTGEATLRRPRTMPEKLMAQFPLTSKKVSPRYDLWGEPITLEGGPLRQYLPYKAKTETTDPVEIESQRLKYYPGVPSIVVDGVKLTQELYDQMLIIGGKDAKRRLDLLVSRENFAYKGDIEKRNLMRNNIQIARKIAKNKIRNMPEFTELKQISESLTKRQ